jgi:CBS domain-containing protein
MVVMGRINRPMMNRFLDEPVRLTSLKQEAGIFLALESPWPIDVKENFIWRLSMKIADIMTTNPDWCVPEASTTQAARIMKRMNVGIVPVLESETSRKLIGVVTDRDLCLTVIANGEHPDAIRVKQVMTTGAVTCRPDDDIQTAADLMRENQIRRVPIVDDQRVLQGMLSLADVLQRSNLSSDATHSTLKKVMEPSRQASKPRAEAEKRAA